jgi:hypothetical protein
MAKKRTSPPPPVERPGVTMDRFERLVQMLHLVAAKPLPRDGLTRRLKIDIRGFYRDLGLVRAAGVGVDLIDGSYALKDDLETALGLLPFPDPHLTLAEMRLLAKGRTAAHRKLRDQLDNVQP